MENAPRAALSSHRPICIHPDHPKCLLFRGRAVKLVTATEHYGAVFNRPFRFERYLNDCGARGINYTRLFALFREQQSATNPHSTCKPDSPEFVAPFERTGPGSAPDGQPKYDLDRPNGEFFDRLHRYMSLAAANGIVVEITLLSNTYADGVWALNPLQAANNINHIENVEWPDYMSLRHAKLWERQSAHVRKMVEETRGYDNVIYEICNEPGGNFRPQDPTLEEVNAWQRAIAAVIREADTNGSGPHLISGEEAFAYRLEDESSRAGPDVFQFSDESFDSLPVDIVNMHPLSNMIARKRSYNVGLFMSGEMRLSDLKRYCLDLYAEKKPLCLDEDNCATQYRDDHGWKIHRKRAWIALFCGAHYDCIDFSINNFVETGYSDESADGIRRAFGHLAVFINSDDLPVAVPAKDVVSRLPEGLIEATLSGSGNRYWIYLADARQPKRGEASPLVSGEVAMRLRPGKYQTRIFSPTTGQYSPWISLVTDRDATIGLPEFRDDIVVCIRPG
jgi:hypothetical protein